MILQVGFWKLVIESLNNLFHVYVFEHKLLQIFESNRLSVLPDEFEWKYGLFVKQQ